MGKDGGISSRDVLHAPESFTQDRHQGVCHTPLRQSKNQHFDICLCVQLDTLIKTRCIALIHEPISNYFKNGLHNRNCLSIN
jgi:hypothetical protein